MKGVVIENSMIFCADRMNGIFSFDAGDPAALKLVGFTSDTAPIPLQIPTDISDSIHKNSIERLLVLGIISGTPDGTIKPNDVLSRAELAVILCNILKAGKAGDDSKQTFNDVPPSHWAFGYIEKAAQLGLVGGKGSGMYDPEASISNAEAASAVLRLVSHTPAAGTWPENVMAECEKCELGQFFEGNAGDSISRGNIFALLDKTVMEIPDAKTQLTLLQSKFAAEAQLPAAPVPVVTEKQIDPNQKIAYITIDDGPSKNATLMNLDTLKKYGIKATFFVLPKSGMNDIYQRIIDEGHVLGNHSYSHDNKYLYSSVANFKKDTIKAQDFIYNLLGYTTTVYRFPGGTMGVGRNAVNARAAILTELGYKYYNWDVSTADTDPNLRTYGNEATIVNILANNIIRNTKGDKKLIILMHDSSGKMTSAKALPKIIEGLQKQGYIFDVLTNY
jgi:peptidoglycan/xylan/chitin deacetylase (PgdA/CDA1 family)